MVALLLGAAVAVAAIVVVSNASRRQTTPATNSVAQTRQRSVLDRRASLVVVDPMAFGPLVQRLEKLYGTRIEVDWDAIAVAPMAPRPGDAVLVELRLRNVTLRQVLAKVLESVDGGGELAVEAAGDAARIVPREPFVDPAAPPPRPVCRLYDVSDLLAMDDFDEHTGLFGDVPGASPAPAAFLGWLCFPPPRQETPDERLQHMVQDDVAPETWLDAGGTGVLWVAGGKMVVVHTPALQQQVVEHLARLREFLRAPYEKGGGHVSPKS
jgi:hypothetical protein